MFRALALRQGDWGQRSKRQVLNSLRWPMNVINLVDNTKLPCSTLPPTLHHSFFRNLPPLFIWLNNCLFQLVNVINLSEYVLQTYLFIFSINSKLSIFIVSPRKHFTFICKIKEFQCIAITALCN